jgi:hypothetical protein
MLYERKDGDNATNESEHRVAGRRSAGACLACGGNQTATKTPQLEVCASKVN